MKNNFISRIKNSCHAKYLHSNGFSTLFVVILLGIVASSLVFTLATSSAWSIRGSIDTKNSNKAKALTNACAEVALEKIRESNSFTGTNSVVLDGNTCSFTVANSGGNNRTITVSGTVNGITRNLNITTNAFNPLNISSWQENS